MSKKIQLNETEIKNIVLEATKQILIKEGFMDKLGKKVSNWSKNVVDKLDDAHRGYDVLEGNPQSIEDVFRGDGWNVLNKTKNANGICYEVTKATGFVGEHYGISPEDMVEELEIFLSDNANGGRVEYLGQDNSRKYIYRFQIYYI